MMFSNVTLDEMFPRALPVMRAPLPILKTENVYNRIRKQATAQGITLTDEHMEAINFVRA